MTNNRKAIDYEIKQCVKFLKKTYGFESRQDKLFKKSGDYFFVISIYATGVSLNKFVIKAFIKPYIADDVFWKIFDMEENLMQPNSLRAVGAFSVSPLLIFENSMLISDVKEIFTFADVQIKEIIEQVHSLVERFNGIEDFYEYSKRLNNVGLYDIDLMLMIIYIVNGKYREAKELAENKILNNEKGRFANRGKYIYEYIIDYCSERLLI